ncbi:uncharacterized protein HMPREF1541_00602 [Cyphellophora europaea CBS 101466]|uniref:Major facilitator superfamily (MFS) profile domain-containing protein n=1 Tax=Cyphellophora europaea (strain CBS 101466) TaxID=1220924 RepID=W2SEH7_CYPE1|nr:uncharacterized protein HMPREF1541_00602 [Cyphellophora europaea CBS 101466]ETN46418.1 hypothetical protein HMPREF1541_00602 [Cyphellophora europaea CBS 101466]
MARDANLSEKETLDHAEVEKSGMGDGLDDENLPRYDDKETKRVLRKVDYRLVPMLTLLYVLAFLDRSNIGNAKIAGMNEELELTGTQYNIALTVFFFPYAIFEVPSNIVLKVMRPSWWIAIMMLAWGVVMTLQGIVQNYEGLVATRTMLGLAESGFFPAATYLLTTWYARFEVQTRLAIFFSAASLASAFSGLLAFGIEHMDGVGGYSGWRWIFLLEGIVTCVVAAVLPWTLPDSPATASFLTPEERDFIARRLVQDSGTSAGKVGTTEGFNWAYLKSALLEWKIWFAVFIYWGNAITIYGFTYTAPTIILQLGYTSANAQLLTIPIYLLGAIATIVVSRIADKRQSRWPFIIGPYAVAAVGFIGLLSIPHPRYPGLTYAFLFCIPAGTYPPLIGCLSWVGNNIAPSWKRAVGMALLISLGNLGGAIGSNVFLQQQAPHYWLGYGMGLFNVTAAIVATLVLKTVYLRQNRKRDAISEQEVRAKYTDEELMVLGDKSPLYRYVV